MAKHFSSDNIPVSFSLMHESQRIMTDTSIQRSLNLSIEKDDSRRLGVIPKSLWIVGGSGAALQVWSVVRALKGATYVHRGFVINESLKFDCEGLDVREENEFLENADPSSDLIVIGIGNPLIRQSLAQKFAQSGFRSPSLVHPFAVVGSHVRMGCGCVVMANAVLETHIHVGDHVLINLAAIVAHEGSIGSFTNVGPNSCLAGGVIIGSRCDIGAGVVVRPRAQLGDQIIVGAGAVVVGDFLESTLLIGVPAKPVPLSGCNG
jgi:sugar O-acyltransferase (sialic acid O-acetyltransferase NeuD family)